MADDDPELRWVLDPETGSIRQGDGDVDRVLVGAAEDLARLVDVATNPGVLLRDGRIRHLSGDGDGAHEEVIEVMNRVCRAFASAASTPDGA